jgi:endonuclease/exonuclease/phosphatase family metal-dependent hydrolase
MFRFMQRRRISKQIRGFFRFLGYRRLCLTVGIFIFFLVLSVTSCRKEPSPPSPDDTKLFAACVIPGTSASLEIVTFNVEGFPKADNTSVTALAALIKTIDPDVVALQEVASETDFNRLVKLLTGWKGYFNPAYNNDWNLSYLVKNSEIETFKSFDKLLFTSDAAAFPRAPYEIKLEHKPSSMVFFLINIHLKCCDGTDNLNSRTSASVKLKNYIDTSRPKDAVIVLGDFNDEISSSSATENPFLNFINDPAGYAFADMAIAKGNALWWSYPSYPSHIDHILVTNELFSSVDTTMVIKVSPCYPDYEANISDHRPVEVKIVWKQQ